MRRQLRDAVPALAYYFGIRPWEIDDLTYGEIDVLLAAVRKLPPMGGTVLVEMKAR